ncbi:MAG: hypothetical protein JWN94_3753 [Betaproteobacteria bacterium]|nr:hypothetical protein [Betaproteobacteria bacterium]
MEPVMDVRLKRKIMLFYAGGIINALLGLYVLIEGVSFLPPDTARTLAIIFCVFAAVDFYLPYTLKQRWLASQAGKQAQSHDPVQRS